MGFLKFIRGLFTKPTQKRVKALKTKETIKYIGIWERPPVGRLSYHDSERICLEMIKYMNANEVAKKLNKMGYLTGHGRKWTSQNVYWHCNKRRYNKATNRADYASLGQRMTYAQRRMEYAQKQNGVN
jgi:dissimilatory sulfite reductase (desulfoviridin) alpha/beta subunit